MKRKKIITFFFIIIFVIITFINTVYAATAINPVLQEDPEYKNKDLTNFANIIATAIRNIGIVSAVIILMILGLKYMIGSAEEKASFKKSAIPYLIGSVLLFGTSGIAQLFITLALQLNKR